jgi:Spy/CpxP family protein refolding chaperone
MKRKPFAATSTLAVTLLTVPVLAGDSAGVTAPFIDKEFEVALRKHFQKKFFNLIDASDTQRDQISAILDDRMEVCRPEREKLRSEAIELSQLMASNASDEQVRSKVKELREVHEKLMDDRLTTALKVRTILKPEQRKAVSDKIVALLSGDGRGRMLR